MIRSFVSFLGPVRTGHTLVGSLLSIHAKIAISLELQPIKLVVRNEYSKEFLFKKILEECSNRESMEMGGYEYLVSQNQRKINDVEIIGDSIAGFKQDIFINERDLKKFFDTIEIPVKWFVVYRNPFDAVTSFHLMTKETLKTNIDYFKTITKRTQERIKIKQIQENLFSFHIESFIEDPKKWMKKICHFLDVDASDKYLNLCSSRVFEKPNRTFNRDLWTKSEIQEINDFTKSVPGLRRYYNEF